MQTSKGLILDQKPKTFSQTIEIVQRTLNNSTVEVISTIESVKKRRNKKEGKADKNQIVNVTITPGTFIQNNRQQVFYKTNLLEQSNIGRNQLYDS